MTTQDKSSTSALRVHAEACYGHEAVKAAKETNNLQATRELVNKVGKQKQGVLTGLFKRMAAKGKEIYATMPLSNAETRSVQQRFVEYATHHVAVPNAPVGVRKTIGPSKLSPTVRSTSL